MILGTFIQGNPADNLIDRMISRTMPTHYENDRVSGTLRWRAFATNTGLNTVSLPNMTSIGYGCFLNCTGLQSVYMPNCTYVSEYAFSGCASLTNLTIPWSEIKSIAAHAFNNCQRLPISLSNNNITILQSNAFYACSKLTDVNCQNVSCISTNALRACTTLSAISASTCSIVWATAFYGCYSLSAVNMPCLITISGNQAFYACSMLSCVDFPALTGALGQDTFRGCGKNEYAILPRVTTIGSSAFMYNGSMSYAIFSGTGTIYPQAFASCTRLLSLYLLGSTIRPLNNVNAFNSTPISTYTTATGGVQGSIFVPASLYSSYIASTNWVTYSNRFVSLTSTEILSITGSWVSSLSATLTYPTSKPLYIDEIKDSLSITATYHNGTSSVLSQDAYGLVGTLEAGCRNIIIVDEAQSAILMVLARKFDLPEEYERVGYLQTPATSDIPYINTEILPKSSDTFITVIQTNSTRNNGQDYIIYTNNSGMRRNSNLWELWANGTRGSYAYCQIYGNAAGGNITTNLTTVFTSYPNSVTRTALTQTATINPSSNPYYVFAQNNNGTAFKNENVGFRIWYIEIPNRLKLIPCKRKSDNVLGMYDLKGNICSLTNTPFFINAGTGSFTYGYNP